MPWFVEKSDGISRERMQQLMQQTIDELRIHVNPSPKKVLLLPPDITRMHSGAGMLTEMLYEMLHEEAEVHVIPTLGQHVPHTEEENRQMFGKVPHERIHAHDWRDGCVQLGEIPADYIKEVSNGAADWAMPIWLNKTLMDGSWDWIINIGHVVPHEVLGFANHNKNYFIGLGGKDLICTSHMMAACCGIENNLGTLITPTRECFNQAEELYLSELPDVYVQIVMARNEADELVQTGLYVGDNLETYMEAARQSREQNITVVEEPLKKVVCVMQGDEFFSTWVANKAVYRTRMALADDGELLILAPGLKRFGEQDEVDEIIRKYGYCGTPKVMQLYSDNEDLQDLAHATAHLIHGSSEDRFKITYAPGKLTRQEMESVNFSYADLDEMVARYQPETRKQGWNETADGEKFYFIPTPSAGLWSTHEKLYQR